MERGVGQRLRRRRGVEDPPHATSRAAGFLVSSQTSQARLPDLDDVPPVPALRVDDALAESTPKLAALLGLRPPRKSRARSAGWA